MLLRDAARWAYGKAPIRRVLPQSVHARVNRDVERRLRLTVMSVGAHTYGDGHIRLRTWGTATKLRIGSFCSIADDVTVFLGGNHHIDWISTYPLAADATAGGLHGERSGQPSTRGDVVIGNDVWIGSGVSIMSGVRIGDGAVIAARSHVVKDVAPYELVGGNPARHIRFRFEASVIEELLTLSWWNWPEEAIAEAADLLSSAPTDQSLAKLQQIAARSADAQ